MNLSDLFSHCRLCPRQCGTDRTGDGRSARSGFCRESARLRVAHVGPHFGEEPPLTGTRGSGTVFFSGCSLRCTYCQNHQISGGGVGRFMTLEELFDRVEEMIRIRGVHNVNLVTPDHFFPYAFALVPLLREKGHDLPIVLNLSGYQSTEILRMADPHADIYLPDFKYSDPGLAKRLSRCEDYFRVALEATSEMVSQKGFLDAAEEDGTLAARGVLVRHLILPGHVENSIEVLTALFLEFGASLPLSLMSQYTPVLPQEDRELNRRLTGEEFQRVYSHAMDLGFDRLFVQFPEESGPREQGVAPFLPDFRRSEPFPGPAD